MKLMNKATMKRAGISHKLSLMALAVMASSFAMADDAGWYGGANIGRSAANIDEKDISVGLMGSGLVTNSINSDEADMGYKIFGGYQFNRNFAFEAGYFDLGEFDFTAVTVPAGTLSGEIELKGMNVDAVGILPFNEKFSAFGRVGLSYVKTEDTFTGTGAVTVLDSSPDGDDVNFKIGAGLEYAFTPSFSMRLEAERYRIDDAVDGRGDVDFASLGVVYRFGQKTPVAEKAPAPEPTPVAAVAPPVVVVKAKTEEYCSFLDIQYEIDQDAIQDEEKEKLAVLGRFLTKYPKTTAIIEGHTDNVGTEEYNQKLSLQRAESVVRYLVDELHIAASRLTAVGYGEANPLVDNSTSAGKEWNRSINAVVSCVTDIEGLSVAYARITMALEVEFDPKSAAIDPSYNVELDKVASYMIAHPQITATVEGHAGKFIGVGTKKEEVTPEDAMKLSKLRAEKVVDYLKSAGVAKSRLSAAPFGQTRRVAYGKTLAGQQENRRVNIIFEYPSKR